MVRPRSCGNRAFGHIPHFTESELSTQGVVRFAENSLTVIMDAEQFQLYRQTLVDIAVDQRDHATVLARRNQQRDVVKRLVKKIDPCDGSSPQKVRDWVLDIEMTLPYINADDASVRTIVEDTIVGQLRREYESFQAGQANRAATTWNDIRQHIRAAFLTADENEFLRSNLEKVKQTQFERNVAFSRRFREAADDAYPAANRGEAEQRIILTQYIKGLRCRDLVKWLIQETRPTTLQEATTAVERFSADDEKFARLGWLDDNRQVEAMEVGAVHQSEMDKKMDGLLRMVTGLQSSFTKLSASTAPTSVPSKSSASQPNRPAQSQRSTGKCFYCDKPGHLKRDCRKRAADMAKSSPAPPREQGN